MWINAFNFRRRATQTAPCLAQCVKYSYSLVGAMRFTLTALCLAQCVKYSCSLVGANMCYMLTAAPRRGIVLFISSPNFMFSSSLNSTN